MAGLNPDVDPDGLLEYSVVYTDRSLNHMSQSFQGTMRHISDTLKKAYNANSAIVVPGSGTYGMESVARQFAAGKRCLVIRNGWFSYRWTQIFDMGNIPSSCTVLKAKPDNQNYQAAYAPVDIDEAVAEIKAEKPALVFAPHVETSSGILLPDDYIRSLADAVHDVGGMLVLDCIASGAMWVDMEKTGVDILISAPQKSWSSSPCCSLVMLNANARKKIDGTSSSSFACDLLKWLSIMETYESGAHAYHATMPTDALTKLSIAMSEIEACGLEDLKAKQIELGAKIRNLLSARGIKSVAAEGFQSPCVVVSYTDEAGIQNGSKFVAQGLQIAAGVPLMCDEPENFQTFRLGLFGLDKLNNIDRTVETFEQALDKTL
ncbi:MAG: alanine--glyoxylate aminotransferase family protein [Kordiimonadaceae bacterium]|jgi:aspartate aminotransferase-like enzyme|nr:alanine--glyoxylate aminotransferase family protein [Kordiimonadaceae bacterium]MBT6036686.1 alanine--glyoxylate aminotransferase family protein [Kordiimonadaceae bacterium]MBT6330461.1 alanine--glyoxylate aminotransferase family protein [Kordiimonadaceae bacterium]